MKELNRVHLNGLRAVEAVYRLGSLQSAADALGVSPGAVSQHLIRTEAQLGRTLFERTPKGLVPINAVIPALQRMSEAFETLASATSLARHRDENMLTISVAPIFASHWLVYRLQNFSRAHPDIRLRIDASLHVVSLSAGDVDAAIRVGYGEWADTDAEFLMREEVFPVCTPSLGKRLKVLPDILRHPVLTDDNSIFGWDVWTREAGLDDRQLQRGSLFSDAALCLQAAMGGQGIALVWQTMAEYALANGQLVEPFQIRAATGRSTYFVTPKGKPLPKAVGVFRQWLKDELKLAGSDGAAPD